MTTSSSPEHGRALLFSTAATSLVLTAVLVANPARAQNECGAPSAGTVTCTASATNYPNGITYTTTTTDLTVVTDNTVTANGPISVTGAAGAATTLTNNGAVTVTQSAPGGLYSASDTGNVSVTNTGTVTTSANGTMGIRAVSGAAGAGSVTVNSTGTVTTSGAGATGVYAGSFGTGPVNVTVASVNATGTGSTAVIAEGGGPVNVTVAKGGNVSGANYGVGVASAKSVTVTNYGTITGGTFAIFSPSGSAPVTINNDAPGVITGPVSFGGSGNVVTNAGTWNISGDSSMGVGGTNTPNVINNYGGTVIVGAPTTGSNAVTIAGLDTWNNKGGAIDISTGNSLDITSAVFNGGDGSQLKINANGPDGILMLGSTGTGTTAVVPVDLLAGKAPAMDFTGIPIVTGAQNGSFTLGGANDWHQGFIDYRLNWAQTSANGQNPALGTYTIFGLPGREVFEALNIPYALQDFWRRSTDSFDARAREIRDIEVQGGTPSRPEGWEIWLQPYGGHDKFDRERTFDFGQNPTFTFSSVGTHTYDIGLQIGADQLGKFRSGYGYWGVTGGLEQMQTFFIGDNQNDLYSLGGNIGVYGGANFGGFYVDAIGKGDFIDMNLNFNSAGFSPDRHFWVWGTRGEVGYRWPFMGFFVEPAARVSAIWTDSTTLHPAGAILNINNDNDPVVLGDVGGRVGTTLGFWGWQFTGYAGAFWSDQWNGKNTITFATSGGPSPTAIDLAQPNTGSFIKVEYGVETGSWLYGLKGFVEGANDVGGDGVGSWSARLGVRFSF